MPGIITQEHLSRDALIYIRQSSPHQVRHHLESQKLQENLTIRALNLGWREERIIVLKHDLGITATGVKRRQDYEDIVDRVSRKTVGGIFVLTASRLARNDLEWCQILEICPVYHTLIIDGEGIYDANLAGDWLWLGMKASFSVYEVKQLQALARAAILNKASRGQLFHNLPAGFVLTEDGRLELAPNQRIQQCLRTIFAKFEELGSIRQVHIWHHREGLEIPVREYKHGVGLAWRLPTYSTLNHILTNPLYAGIYQYPRTTTRTRVVDGRVVKTSGHRVTPDDKSILIPNLFEGYISAEQFERNQKIIAHNTQMRGQVVLGAPREGASLLAGFVKCGHCSRTMRVHYATGDRAPSYYCPRHLKAAHAQSCLRLSGKFLEQYVNAQILTAVAPLAIEAALLAEDNLNHATQEKAKALSYALQQAQYEAGRIERQFNANDPEDRLVCDMLSKRLEAALAKVNELKLRHAHAQAEQTSLTESERARLFELAEDLKKVWDHPQTNDQIKTRLVRLLVKEVWVKALDSDRIQATIHWQGEIHTQFEFHRGRSAPCRDDVKEQQQTVELIQRLALVCDDQQITRILNRAKIQDAKHTSWSEFEIAALRKKNKIAPFCREQYEQRGLVNLKQAAEILQASAESVLQLIRCGLINAQQVMKFAPWEIERTELDKPAVRRAIVALRNGQPIPFHENQQDLTLQ